MKTQERAQTPKFDTSTSSNTSQDKLHHTSIACLPRRWNYRNKVSSKIQEWKPMEKLCRETSNKSSLRLVTNPKKKKYERIEQTRKKLGCPKLSRFPILIVTCWRRKMANSSTHIFDIYLLSNKI